MKIERVSQRLGERTVSNKVEYARNVILCMTGNSNFSMPNPPLATVTTAIDNLDDAAAAAVSGGKNKTNAMNSKEDVLDNLLSQLGNYVESTASAAAATGGDAKTIITSAGMDYARPKNKAPLPLAPDGVKAVSTAEGQIDLNWKGVKYSRAYVVEISSDVAAITPTSGTTPVTTRVFISWVITDVCTKSKCTITGLISGTKYAFRVYAVGTAGKGAVSVPVVVKVL